MSGPWAEPHSWRCWDESCSWIASPLDDTESHTLDFQGERVLVLVWINNYNQTDVDILSASLRWRVPGLVTMTTTHLIRMESSVSTLWSITCTLRLGSVVTACSTPLLWVEQLQNSFWMGTFKLWTWADSASDASWHRNPWWRGTSCRTKQCVTSRTSYVERLLKGQTNWSTSRLTSCSVLTRSPWWRGIMSRGSRIWTCLIQTFATLSQLLFFSWLFVKKKKNCIDVKKCHQLLPHNGT